RTRPPGHVSPRRLRGAPAGGRRPTHRRAAAPARVGVKGAFAWLRRWGISIASLIGGLLTLFVFRRELPHVRWIVGYLLLLWLLSALAVQVRDAFATSKTGRLVLTATDYTIQSLYH